ncbi:MAG: MFS transporter [Microlunatus sp.]|nr:MFS transporter [Microlunatus sp.]
MDTDRAPEGRERGTGHSLGGGVRKVAGGVGHGVRGGLRRVVDYSDSGGAGPTGLGKLVRLEFTDSVGDAVVTIALAGTVFFGMPTDEARPEVARFLALTMVPLAVLAPFIGPFLDRFRHGRRWAIGASTALRAFLAWVLAGVVHDPHSAWLFVCALGVLVANKANTVSRAAAVPRLLPEGFTLVNANSRLSMANVVGLAVGGVLGGALVRLGPQWSLRFAFVVFLVAVVQTILLPGRVDSAKGERSAGAVFWRRKHGPEDRRRFRNMTAPVQLALLANLGAKLMGGFLTFFLAFLFRDHPLGNLPALVALGIVVAVSGIGNAVGTVLGNLLKDKRPELIALIFLAVDAAMAVATAVFYSAPTVIAMGFVAGLSTQMVKLGYNALVQRDVDDAVQASVFARSEAVFQICWVAGGFLGIALPLVPRLGFGTVAALLLVVAVLIAIHWIRTHRQPLFAETELSTPQQG